MSIYREYQGLELGFTRAAIAAAKEGVHQIAWSPFQPKEPTVCTKVRGFHAWVRCVGSGAEIRLNRGATVCLLKGCYR